MIGGHGRNPGILADVADAVSKKSVFHVYYNPRASQSEFIITHSKFSRSLSRSFSIGMRFKMQLESEDAAEKRHTGWITGIGDMDPGRWPGSKWRCLLVRWDDDLDPSRKNRVSPWEVELVGSVSGSLPSSKRTKISLPSADSDTPFPNGSGYPDFEESERFHKVLQGQEIMHFSTPYGGMDATSSPVFETRNHRCLERSGVGGSGFSYNRLGFGEPLRFHKVLQGQEIFPLGVPYRGTPVDAQSFGGGSSWALPIQGYNGLIQSSFTSAPVCPSSSALQQVASQFRYPQSSGAGGLAKNDCHNYLGLSDHANLSTRNEAASHYRPNYMMNTPINERFETRKVNESAEKLELIGQSAGENSCRLFGFSLTERIPISNMVDDTLPVTPKAMDMNYASSSHILSFKSQLNLLGTVALK